MAKFYKIRGLLIDIDDTIVRFRPDGERGDKSKQDTGSLMGVLQRAGVELGRFTPEETAQRIQKIKTEVRWWHWSDFIVELGLNPKQFWEYAYELESKYLEATGPEILSALHRLRESGILLYVTSNNPSSGILHKLRLAGIGHVTGTTLFSQLLGGTELHAMKWEPIYWKKALAHIALDPHEVAVVGDNPHDDYEVPHSVGIPYSFIMNRGEDRSAQNMESLVYVQSFDQVADHVLGGRR